ncbi:YqcI/YcgG family protein [Streptomyces achromogenes]|uniref:YqcI/YcgG family protein n=1 Tax=Streptomyces achromogenes TaxID=67255 RepID=UPI002284DE19|nr:YqcI/YcgG family protein [Streptomyces sp. UMAF16]
MPPAELWTAEQMAQADPADPLWSWVVPAFREFDRTLTDESAKFPCLFGVGAQNNGHNSFTALDTRLPHTHGVERLAQTLRAFRDKAWTGPRRQSLVVFVGPPAEVPDLDHDRERFWRLLGDLRAHDRSPWPENCPSDPADPKWDWCFAGEPWFTFMCSPAYAARRSRAIGHCLTVIFQTRRIFEGLAGNTPAGRKAKQNVRDRLAGYEELPPHPHLGSAERQVDYKWRQYFLPDDLTEFPVDACPYKGT